MGERLVLLPGWGFLPAALAPLKAALGEHYPLVVDIQPLPLLEESGLWLDWLDEHIAADAWLGGWSLGGMLAVQLAARRGSHCPGVLTLNSNACFQVRPDWPSAMSTAALAAFVHGFARNPTDTLRRFAQLCAQGSPGARPLVKALRTLLYPPETLGLAAGLNLLGQVDNRSALVGLAGRQLHLFSGADALVPAAASQAMQRLLPGDQVQLLADTSHALPWEYPERVAHCCESLWEVRR